MTITTLPAVLTSTSAKPEVDNVAELQGFARHIAVEGIWNAEIARSTAVLFDGIASTWNTERSTGRFDPVVDALARGRVPTGGRCLEVGSGTGQITPYLANRFDTVVAVDLSAAMLAEAAGSPGVRVRCDASRLPFRDAVFAAAVLVDTFCFAGELARVLATTGVVVWINQLGADGPLYVPARDIADAIPGDWNGVESTAGWGSWAVLRRIT